MMCRCVNEFLRDCNDVIFLHMSIGNSAIFCRHYHARYRVKAPLHENNIDSRLFN